MTKTPITADMTMEAILAAYPSAQRALFQRYHVGGCSSCAFQPSETLEEVCRDHNILDVNEVIAHLERSQELDDKIRVDAREVKGWLDAGEDFTFLDVRAPEERAATPVPEAEPLDFADSQRYMALPKERRIAFLCGNGDKSLDVASYFIGHGFTNAFAVRGGREAWQREVEAADAAR